MHRWCFNSIDTLFRALDDTKLFILFLCVFNFWKLSKDTCPSRRQIYRATFDIISGKGGMILTFVKQLRYLFLKVLIDEAFDAVFLSVSLDDFLK